MPIVAFFLKLFGVNLSDAAVKAIFWAVIVLAVIGAGVWFKAEIKHQIYAQFYQQEVEQKYKEQQGQITILQKTIVNQQVIIRKANEDRQRLSRSLDDVRTHIMNAPATADGPVAPVLRDTIDGLRKLQEVPNAPTH